MRPRVVRQGARWLERIDDIAKHGPARPRLQELLHGHRKATVAAHHEGGERGRLITSDETSNVRTEAAVGDDWRIGRDLSQRGRRRSGGRKIALAMEMAEHHVWHGVSRRDKELIDICDERDRRPRSEFT
jgi:hypothetical protein